MTALGARVGEALGDRVAQKTTSGVEKAAAGNDAQVGIASVLLSGTEGSWNFQFTPCVLNVMCSSIAYVPVDQLRTLVTVRVNCFSQTKKQYPIQHTKTV